MVDLSKYDQHSIGKLFDFSVLPKNTNEASIREGCRIAINTIVLLSTVPAHSGLRLLKKNWPEVMFWLPLQSIFLLELPHQL